MNLDNIVIILSRPKYSGNIGSVCRAMKAFDITHLRIVGEKASYNDSEIMTMAVHAKDIWLDSKEFSTIKDALSDCAAAIGTTRRHGARRGRLLLPAELATRANLVTDSGARVALVFGNEETGLTDDELFFCTECATIPSSKKFGSLNLSHAVEVLCYTLFVKTLHYNSSYCPITLERVSGCVEAITKSLKSTGFFKQAGEEDMTRFWRGVLSRSQLSEGEAQYIEEIFSKVAGLVKKSDKKNEL